MRLPDHVLALIDQQVAHHRVTKLVHTSRLLTDRYRNKQEISFTAPLLSTSEDLAAYLTMRMPATYAATSAAMQALRDSVPDFAPASVLDLGAGPGTGALAAVATFASLGSATLIERDPRLHGFAHAALAPYHPRSLNIIPADLSSATLPAADLVLCAYTLNELPPEQVTPLIQRAWSAAQVALIFVEPGSRAGFANILTAREFLISTEGARIAAPCPGAMPCPLARLGDWCHFAARVQRSAQHRRLKQGELSYEDEKFSYVAAVKVASSPAAARVVRRPEKLKGHVKLNLCTLAGLQLTTISHKQGPLYKQARNAKWGDSFPLPPPNEKDSR